MSLGKKLQTLRKQKSMSQEQLAEELNVSRQAVSKWELDATLPDTTNVISLSRIFNVSIDFLLLDENENTQPQETEAAKSKWHVIAGIVCAALGAAGVLILFIASRFVEVMVPRVEYNINGTQTTTWDSNITDIDFRLFIEEYELKGLLIFFAMLIVAGCVLMALERIKPVIKKLRRQLGSEFY